MSIFFWLARISVLFQCTVSFFHSPLSRIFAPLFISLFFFVVTSNQFFFILLHTLAIPAVLLILNDIFCTFHAMNLHLLIFAFFFHLFFFLSIFLLYCYFAFPSFPSYAPSHSRVRVCVYYFQVQEFLL